MNTREQALELVDIALSSLGCGMTVDSVSREGMASDFERWLKDNAPEWDWEDYD